MEREEEQEIIHRSAATKDKNRRRWLRFIGLIFVICLLGGGTAAVVTYATLKSSAEQGTVLAQQIQQACENPGVIDPDLAQFCPRADDVVENAPETVKVEKIPGLPGEDGEQGEQGEKGDTGTTGPPPSSTAVYAAVRRLCAETGRCDAKDGSDATPAQVAVAVSSYCNSRGQCKGPAGENGEDGTDGQNGSDGLNGKDASPVTQSQIISAVESYCSSRNNCQGPAGSDGNAGATGDVGPAGPQGPPGPEGPAGVVNVADNCEAAPEGQVIDDVNTSYDQATLTVIIDCTYRDLTPVLTP